MRINFGGALGIQDASGFLVSGGKQEGGSVSGATWFYLPHEGWPDYDPAALSPGTYDYWLTLSDMPTPRYDFATTTLGGWVYALGGVTANGNVSNAVEALNLQTAVWVTMPAMVKPDTGKPGVRLPAPRAGALAVSHEIEQFIGVFGGYSGISG